MFRRALFSLSFVLFFPSLLHAAQFNLDTPAPGSFVSGLGFVAGWKCSGGNLTFSIDGGQQAPLVYKIIRGDTFGSCGDTDNGFLAQFNWSLASGGEHTIRIYDNGSQFAQATFTVTTLGVQYLTGASAVCSTSIADKNVTLTWQENQQNFIITGAGAGGGFSGTYNIIAPKISDTCSLSAGGSMDTLTATQNGFTLTGAIASTPGFQYAGEVDGAGNFLLSLTTLKVGISSGCTFLGVILESGNFSDGSVTVSIDRRQVSGICPSVVNCDTVFNGTLTKTSALQSGTSGSPPFGEGEGSSVDELINELFE